MKKGSVILIPFPFTDLKGSKIRPTVVLSNNELDVTICFITSEFKWKTEYDISILTSSKKNQFLDLVASLVNSCENIYESLFIKFSIFAINFSVGSRSGLTSFSLRSNQSS